VRKDLPLLVRTSTVAADELVPAADVADDDGADDDAADDDAADAELCEPPELQAAARTPAAASGRPNLRASETFLDDRMLFICCAFPSNGIPSARRIPCITQYANAAKAVRWMFYVSRHRAIRRLREFVQRGSGCRRHLNWRRSRVVSIGMRNYVIDPSG
jgi:hypothetical protein